MGLASKNALQSLAMISESANSQNPVAVHCVARACRGSRRMRGQLGNSLTNRGRYYG
jgi:hypothetical protein